MLAYSTGNQTTQGNPTKLWQYLIWYDPGDCPVAGVCFDGGVLHPPYCPREFPPHPKPRQSRQHLEQFLVVLFAQVLKQLWRSASHQGTAVFMAGVQSTPGNYCVTPAYMFVYGFSHWT